MLEESQETKESYVFKIKDLYVCVGTKDDEGRAQEVATTKEEKEQQRDPRYPGEKVEEKKEL